MNYAPFVRISLRYILGGVFVGSPAIGAQLAADPDIVAAVSAALAIAVEAVYSLAKRKGWAT